MNKSAIRQVIELKDKNIEELRAMHKSLFSEKIVSNSNRRQLIPKIAYRLQELSIGGLSNDTRDKLKKVARGASLASVRPHTDLLPGTKLCREYNGVMHEVEVTKSAFEYQGQPFKSLSAIARNITGTRWNGPKFFKLRSST